MTSHWDSLGHPSHKPFFLGLQWIVRGPYGRRWKLARSFYQPSILCLPPPGTTELTATGFNAPWYTTMKQAEYRRQTTVSKHWTVDVLDLLSLRNEKLNYKSYVSSSCLSPGHSLYQGPAGAPSSGHHLTELKKQIPEFRAMKVTGND